MVAKPKYKLQKNGEDVTAQQAYDAFMNGVVLLEYEGLGVEMTTAMVWRDSNGGQNDPGDVVGVRFFINGKPYIDIGNMPAD